MIAVDSSQVSRKLILVRLRLLNAEDVRALFLEPVENALPVGGPDAVHIPRYDLYRCQW